MIDLESIAERLKFTMSLQGFSQVSKRPREFQRYERRGSPIAFAVGIEQDTKLKDLYVDLVCSYDVPEYVDAEKMFPEQSLIKDFLADTGVEYFHEKADAVEFGLEDRSITMDCELRLKDDINDDAIITAAYTLIEYICDTVTRNIQMMETMNALRKTSI